MDVGMIIFLVVVVFVFGYAVLIYNNLVNLKHAVSQAWSNIDVLLKQRHDELPKLVETCKQYMKHERETLEAAYNDERGVTADFNLNLLERVNRELDADFDLDAFDRNCAAMDAVRGENDDLFPDVLLSAGIR